MSNILTPLSLWKNFNADLAVMPVTLDENTEDGIKYEYVAFSGRETGMGRVCISGVVAYHEESPSRECVLILRDEHDDVDEKMLAYFVKSGYSALYVDYSGAAKGKERFTQYPDNVSYANSVFCGRHKDFVDETAKETTWYEWVAVGIYARKYLQEKFLTENIGLIGIGEGGEIAWKLATISRFSCAVTVNACGWKAYRGYGKFFGTEPELDEERYKFVAGIDSQSYAPYVKCPVLILCSTNNPEFNYDRAFDTFSRINPQYAGLSSIAYSINTGKRIDLRGTKDMLMFLDGYVKGRHVFMPKPADISVSVDENSNLVAKVVCDSKGIIEKSGVFIAEDCVDFSTRDWVLAPFKRNINSSESEYLLNIYEKTSLIFVMCYVVYSSGFTVWSKLAVKKISGRFRNSQAKSRIIYTNKFGAESFAVAECSESAVGNIFLTNDEILPQMVTMCDLSGIYSTGGLATNRIKAPRFAPDRDSILKLDICADENITIDISLKKGNNGETFYIKQNVIGGVWQSQILNPKMFKNNNGISLNNFIGCETLILTASGKFALNNLIWL